MTRQITPCPQCGEALREPRLCGCGLDPTLLFVVKNAAVGLARKAARMAADGEWQHAAEASSESLRMESRDNDLAAFILLLARLAGARGGPVEVVEPRPDALPDQLRPHVAPIVDAVKALRALGLGDNIDERAVREGLQSVEAAWPETGWITEVPGGDEVGSGRGNYWPISRRVAVIVTAFVLGAGLTGGAWMLSRGGGEDTVHFVADADESPSEDHGMVSDLEQRLRASEQQANMVAARSEAMEALLSDDWPRFAESFRTLQSNPDGVSIHDVIPPASARKVYLAGLRESRRENYEAAALLLGVAFAIAPVDSYYKDDALYFEARAFQRLGRQEEAVEAFDHLLDEMPDSPYGDDAARFLKAMRGGRADGG